MSTTATTTSGTNSSPGEKEKTGRRWTLEAEVDLIWTLIITAGGSSASQNWTFIQEIMEKLGHEFNANGIR
jgi:molybdopterin biosynthesis enzyme